ncbi:hypothetical protein PVK06_021222 [Gossypium arboreum]|uniref:Uncharacterized protein n=1 Tax=Gossypium arboreum TaxID=29729 RepID=A0ABR0PQ51_GOSAR|nr:hypothetical protein PVK06_021222 [Gossypium arboreum]
MGFNLACATLEDHRCHAPPPHRRFTDQDRVLLRISRKHEARQKGTAGSARFGGTVDGGSTYDVGIGVLREILFWFWAVLGYRIGLVVNGFD